MWTVNVWRSDSPSFASPIAVPELQFSLQTQGYQVATPFFFKVGQQWYLSYQYTGNGPPNYGYHRWDVGLTAVNGNLFDALPGVSGNPEDYGTLAFWLNPTVNKITFDESGYVVGGTD